MKRKMIAVCCILLACSFAFTAGTIKEAYCQAPAAEAESNTIDLNEIPRDWVGEYDGISNNTVVRRNYAIHINVITPEGEVSGTAEFSPSDKAPAELSYSGAYYFGGFINERTGEIRIQGNRWDIKPIDNFRFVVLNGIIDSDYRTIQGNSEHGIWYMESTDQAEISLYVDDDNVLHLDDGHGYKVFETQDGNWKSALAYCQQAGGHLATITSRSENDNIYGYLRMAGYENVYFGLTDVFKEGEWSWITGEEYSYSNWADGEPDNGNGNEDFAMFYYQYSDGKWNDGEFGESNPAFLCEWDNYKEDNKPVQAP